MKVRECCLGHVDPGTSGSSGYVVQSAGNKCGQGVRDLSSSKYRGQEMPYVETKVLHESVGI